ncbi:hypothetical protein [Staphylococcus xylosus]
MTYEDLETGISKYIDYYMEKDTFQNLMD